MKHVLKLVGREGGKAYEEFDLDEADVSLVLGTRPLFVMLLDTPQGRKRVTITATVERQS